MIGQRGRRGPEVDHGDLRRGELLELGYECLIGVSQSYFGHDESARWAPGMKSIAAAL